MAKATGFSERMGVLGDKAVSIIEKYFDGKTKGSDQVSAALNVLSKAIQVRHQERLSKQIDRSQNLRTAQFILDDPESRRAYIAAQHPEIRQFLPSSAEGKKKK